MAKVQVKLAFSGTVQFGDPFERLTFEGVPPLTASEMDCVDGDTKAARRFTAVAPVAGGMTIENATLVD